MDNYQQSLADLMREVRQIEITQRDWYYQFAVFSANLGLLLPDIPFGEHIPLFRKTILNQRLVNLDEHFYKELPVSWGENRTLDWEGLRSGPSIICTFHTGSYRLLCYFLMQQGISIALLLSKDVAESQGGGMLERASHIARSNGATCTLVDAQHPTAGLKILRMLREGKVVVGYVDGNMGSLANEHTANLVPIRFLGRTIRVRVGLARLAQRAGATVYGVMGIRDRKGGAGMYCSRVIMPADMPTGGAADTEMTQWLYADLEKVVAENPWLWENWLYLQEQLF